MSFGLGAAQHPPRPECLYTRHALSCIIESAWMVVMGGQTPGRLVMYVWSIQNPGRLVMHDWSMHQHQANIPDKMQSNLRARHYTSHLEAFFRADSGNESDGERKKLKTAGK